MNQLHQKLAAQIRIQGAVSFARFMELALYCPVYGYYEKEGDTVGRRGDFYTSVSVGDLFGKLLAVRFADWFREQPKVRGPKSKFGRSPQSTICGPQSTVHGPKPAVHRTKSFERLGSNSLQLIEAGAHNGELAKDILGWFRAWRPEVFEQLEYWIIEPSGRRRQWQKELLSEFLGKVTLAKDFAKVAAMARSVPGYRIIFCNELLDAMPVHRWGWDAKSKTWFEWGVTLDQERFVWTRIPPKEVQSPKSKVQRHPQPAVHGLEPWFYLSPGLSDVLPDGFTVETCPAAIAWWRRAAGLLSWGKLVTIDYGLTQEELVVPERTNGTLRAYRKQRLSPDVLAEPGQQDLTAHVNFTALQQCGEYVGLKTEALVTQSQFLTSIGSLIWNGASDFETWTPKHTRQFRTLTDPQHLGHTFRVLVQTR